MKDKDGKVVGGKVIDGKAEDIKGDVKEK